MTLLACGFLFAAMVAVFATSAHCESSPVLEWVRSILILTVGYMLGSLKVMQWFNVAVKAMWASRNHGGYSDLSHVFLNLEERSAWMNLGLWRPIRTSNNNEQSLNQGSTQEVDDSTSYPQACEALAVALGNAANIQPGHRILDAGFGRGEQLLVWLTKFKAGFVFGVNTSKDEVDYFLSRPKTGIDPERVEVELGSATSLPPDHSGTYDRVLALDCAYHFTPSRLIFFQEAFRVLKPGGVLALTDIVPISDMLQLSFLRRHALKLACGASGLPYTNLQHGTEAAYRDSLCRAGFQKQSIKIQDISSSVFPGFYSWVERHCSKFEHQCGPRGPQGELALARLRLAGPLAQWAMNTGALRFILVTATKAEDS